MCPHFMMNRLDMVIIAGSFHPVINKDGSGDEFRNGTV